MLETAGYISQSPIDAISDSVVRVKFTFSFMVWMIKHGVRFDTARHRALDRNLPLVRLSLCEILLAGSLADAIMSVVL